VTSDKEVIAGKSMAQQLASLQPKLRQRYSSVVAISQVSLRLVGDDHDAAFEKARSQIVRWLAGRAGRPLPPEAQRGEPFELEELGAQRLGVATLDSPRYWATRLDDADKTVPQRMWVTEAGVAVDPAVGVLVGARLVCSTRGDNVPFQRSVPGFIKQIVQGTSALLDGYKVRTKPWLVATEDDVEQLVGLIRSPDRRSDVIVFSLPEGSEDPSETAASAEDVCNRTVGAAHVVVPTGPASYLLSDAFGKEFSVFLQAVRTYRPRFDENEAQRYEHPLTLPHRIADWPNGGPTAYAGFLVDVSLGRSVAESDYERIVPSFSTVRRVAARSRLEVARKHDSSTTDLLGLADEEIRNLQRELEEQASTYGSLLQTAEQEREEAKRNVEATRARNSALLARVETLEQKARAIGTGAVDLPSTLDNFEDWCNRNLAGVVEVHSRAYQGVKNSEYQDNALLYKALLILRDH
jgi:hypothetical protein